MSQTPVLPEGSDRRRRPRITIAHITFAILWLAFAFWILRPLGQDSLTRADSIVFALTEIGSRTTLMAGWLALAATVLAIARHTLRGGYPRPAEWLALALVLCWSPDPLKGLSDAFWIGLHSLTVHPIEIGSIIYAPRATTLGLFFALVGCLVFAAARRTIPSRARTPIIVILALVVVWGAMPSIAAEFLPRITAFTFAYPSLPQQAVTTGCLVLMRVVFEVPVTLPAIATVREYRRRDRPAWSLGERLGAVAGLLAPLSWVVGVLDYGVTRLPASMLGGAAISPGSLDLLGPGTWTAAFGISAIVVRRYGTAWNHWLNAEAD